MRSGYYAFRIWLFRHQPERFIPVRFGKKLHSGCDRCCFVGRPSAVSKLAVAVSPISRKTTNKRIIDRASRFPSSEGLNSAMTLSEKLRIRIRFSICQHLFADR
uniref:Uncharacterized protein n=1 Tax=Salmonella sp. TaxID=599 RepID=A0A482ET64_SALSP|nr:hypothetical protein NNIBIDOC_00044 [Salmonella sp.]